MKIRLENLEKKVVASDRNQPRIYLTKQEAQRFDLARPVSVTIEQEDYIVVDAEVIEILNQKLSLWFQEQSEVQLNALDIFIHTILKQHQFEEVARNQGNIVFARNGKYINVRFPINQNQLNSAFQRNLNFPLFGFDDQINWLKTNAFKFNVIPETAAGSNTIDFDEIMKDVYAGGLIISGVIVNQAGQIVHCSKNWALNPEELKTCIEYWQGNWRHLTLQNIRYALLFSQPDYFSAVNHKEKIWLVGAVSLETAGQKYYILGRTAAGTDGKNAYVDIARAANRIKAEKDVSGTTTIPLDKPTTLVNAEYEFIIALETQLGCVIPVVTKVEYNTFGFITQNNHIIELGLFGKNLTTLPESLGNLQSLRTLYVWNNRLASLPASLGQLSALKILSVCSNPLSTLPDSIGQLKSLVYLNLNSNQLTSLPESIGNLSMLRDLRLYSNNLTALPTSIGNLTNLEILWLQENKLESLPGSFGQLLSLTYLILSGNLLVTLPENIGNLKTLQQFELGDNRLTSLPESFGQLSALKCLGIGGNEFTSLPASLGNLGALEDLNIDTNKVMPLPLPDSIVQLKALKHFELGLIRFDSFPEHTKKALKVLEKQGCLDISFLSLENDPGRDLIKNMTEKIIKSWENLSQSTWDEVKKTEIMEWIKSNDYFLNNRKICDIKLQLVQSGIEHKKITEWADLDEENDPDLAMKNLIELHDRLESKKKILHPSIWVYLKKCLLAKSKKFQEKIPFTV